jgi:hypothetical protein
MTSIKLVITALVLAVTLGGTAQAQTLEKRQLTLGVGGKTALYYLPLTIAERLGHRSMPPWTHSWHDPHTWCTNSCK